MKEAMLSAEPSETVREDVRCNLPVGFALVREARVVAVGVSFPTAGAVVQWLGEHRSTVVWPDMTDAMVVHGHEGTELIWDDRAWPPAQDAHTPRTAPQTRSGGTESGEGREGGSLGDRLRTEADDYDRAHNGESVFTATLRYLAHEADALRTERDALWTQVYAVRTAIEREAAHGDAVTRCNLVAERFRTVLDGAAPKEPR